MIDTDQLERLKESLLSLAGIPVEQKREWVRRRLGDDRELHDEVISLLEAAGLTRAGTIEPLFAPARGAAGSGMMPEQIGPYAIEAVLGHGGMASVYRARQLKPVERVVALKVLKPGTFTPSLVARFMAERQTIARLEHRNIARLLDAGEDQWGQPYVAVELIDGPSLTEYARIHRLGLREKLEMFVQVCRGVQHAHARGFLHRDLKPSNILIAEEDTGPVPKVIDFGVSKALLDDAATPRQTASGEVLGTVEYMSPEQADPLQPVPDVRCDVYSLGVVLYELLTGTLPFKESLLRGRSSAQIHAFLMSVRPEAPSRRVIANAQDQQTNGNGAVELKTRGAVEALPVDLDYVALKALSADPEMRYASARDLCEDVERWLRDEPVLARPPSGWYLARRFVRRHRIATGAAAIVLLALTASLTVIAISLANVKKERDRVQRALQESEEIVEQLRHSYFAVLPSDLGPDAKVRDMLRRTGERVLKDPPKSDFVRAQMAQALAEPLTELGDAALAEKLSKMAVEGFRADIAAGVDPTHRREALAFNAMSTLAAINEADLRPREAKALFEESLALAQRVNDPKLILNSRLRLAAVDERLMDFERSLGAHDDILRTLDSSPDSQKRRTVVKAMKLDQLIEMERPAEAAALAEEVIAARQSENRENDTTLAMVRNYYGWALTDLGRYSDATAVLNQSVAQNRALMGICASKVLLARANALGSPTEANIQAFKDLLKSLGSEGEALAATWPPMLVECLFKAGRTDDAVSEAAEFMRGIDMTSTLRTKPLFEIGRVLHNGGAAEQAVVPLEKAYEDLSSSIGSATWICRRIASMLAEDYGKLGQLERVSTWKRLAR